MEISTDNTSFKQFGTVFGFYFNDTYSDSNVPGNDYNFVVDSTPEFPNDDTSWYITLRDTSGNDLYKMKADDIKPVPEPATLLLLGGGLLGLAGVGR